MQNLNKYLTSRSNNQYLRKVTKLIEINFDIIETPLSEKLENFKLIGAIDKGKFSKISSKGEFENNKYLDITLKSDKTNKKIFRNLF